MQDIYREIQREYELNRKRALDEVESKKRTLYEKEPKLQEIDDDITKTGVAITKSLIFTDDDFVRNDKIEELKKQIEILKQKKKEFLSNLNIDEKYLLPRFNCNICEDTGIIGAIGGSKPCTCFRQKVIDYTYNESQLCNIEKENFQNFNESLFSDKPNKDKYNSAKSPRENIIAIKNRALEFVENFENESNRNLLFVGGTGLGKTYISSAITKAMLEKGKTVIYQTSGKLMDIIMDYRLNRDNGAIDASQYNELFTVDLLIIDDLGTENMTESRRSELFNILNTRISNAQKKRIRTVISTNKELKELVSYYDQRIVSRLLGNFDVYRFFGEDLRLSV